jgi:hypothetical protein
MVPVPRYSPDIAFIFELYLPGIAFFLVSDR